MQSAWSSQLDPVLANPVCSSSILSNIVVKTGSNTINHLLGQKLQGYVVIMTNAAVTFYDTQSTNPNPQQTLQLVASGPATISLLVF